MPLDHADPHHLEELRALARDLALRAGQEHRAGSSETLETESKSSPTDLVSQVDRRTEDVLVAALRRARPDDGIVGEEGTLVTGSNGVRWLIDPLDGTTNYLYGYPVFCVSIAVEVDGRLQVGVVHETPTGHTYEGIVGRGAVCDGRPIAARRSAGLDTALVATGFSYDAELRARQGAALAHILPRIGDIRRAGSAALDLCQVAAGHLDGYFELDLGPWDYAAGSAIAAAAGADVRHIAAASGRGPAVVAAAPALMPPLLALLADADVLPPASSPCTH